MKKRFSRILCCLFTCFLFLFAVAACKEEKNVNNGVLDYDAEVIVIPERDTFAPCNFYDFFYGNPHMEKFFQYAYTTATRQPAFDVTINGKQWTRVELATQDLPKGTYKIIIETPEEFYLIVTQEDGSREKVPYRKKMTITVSVSTAYEDKYSIE
ncbi:MAG: hypothetical protein IJ317_04505 [Clostridia bacterium]|nr:hypothetical protein [Clostridia bacterium]